MLSDITNFVFRQITWAPCVHWTTGRHSYDTDQQTWIGGDLLVSSIEVVEWIKELTNRRRYLEGLTYRVYRLYLLWENTVVKKLSHLLDWETNWIVEAFIDIENLGGHCWEKEVHKQSKELNTLSMKVPIWTIGFRWFWCSRETSPLGRWSSSVLGS